MEPAPWIPAVSATIAWSSTLQATSLAVVFLSSGKRSLPGRAIVAAQLGLVTCLSAIVLLSHDDRLGDPRALELFETFAWLLAGPLFLFYVRRTLALAPPSPLHLLPAMVLGALTVTGQPGPGPLPLMLHQGAYTLLGLWLYRRTPHDGGAARWWLRTWLWFLAAIHSAQLVRFAYARVEALDNVVPLTIAAALSTITVLGLRHSALMREDDRLRERPAEGSDTDLAQRIRDTLERDRLYVDPDLTVQRLARSLSTPRADVSACLNQELGVGFLDLVGRYRVEEAKRLLREPELEHLTVEAIGRRAGFRTRSTFYERFRSLTGVTPASFRQPSCPNDV